MELLQNRLITTRGEALPRDLLKTLGQFDNVPDYRQILSAANGIVVRHGTFRIFGVGPTSATRDAVAWNRCRWRSHFSGLADTVLFWGESIFGDQFGFDLAQQRIVVLECEGGQLSISPYRRLADCIGHHMLVDTPEADTRLLEEAERHGLRPTVTEHLSFVVPLVCGGRAEPENLEVLDGESHLDLLGQIIRQIADLPEDAKIDKFEG